MQRVDHQRSVTVALPLLELSLLLLRVSCSLLSCAFQLLLQLRLLSVQRVPLLSPCSPKLVAAAQHEDEALGKNTNQASFATLPRLH